MKVVFNFNSTVLALATFIALTLAPNVSHASTYYTRASVLKSFFATSEKVSYIKYTPTKRERRTLNGRLGYKLTRKSYYFFVATTRGKIDGYAFIGNQRGQHKPITFAVKLSRDGVVRRQEVMVYREAWGSGIRDPRFRKQFVGKTVRDPLRLDADIDAISGATRSSNSMVIGVRRALILFEAAVRRPVRRASRMSSHAGASAPR